MTSDLDKQIVLVVKMTRCSAASWRRHWLVRVSCPYGGDREEASAIAGRWMGDSTLCDPRPAAPYRWKDR